MIINEKWIFVYRISQFGSVFNFRKPYPYGYTDQNRISEYGPYHV